MPSSPARGDLLTVNIMLRVGSSTMMGGMATGFANWVIVSPILMFSMPAMATISPQPA